MWTKRIYENIENMWENTSYMCECVRTCTNEAHPHILTLNTMSESSLSFSQSFSLLYYTLFPLAHKHYVRIQTLEHDA